MRTLLLAAPCAPSLAFKHKTAVAFAFPATKATFATIRFSLDRAAEAYAHVMRGKKTEMTRGAARFV